MILDNLFKNLIYDPVSVLGLLVFYILSLTKIPAKTYLKRLTLDIPFVLFALFLPFLSSENNDKIFEIFSLNVYQTGVNDMFTILFKATLGLTVGIILTGVTSSMEIIYGLQKLKIPNIIIAIMSFTIRYIDVFIDEFKRVKISMASGGYVEKGLKTLIPIAFASGALATVSPGDRVDQSQVVHNQCISRFGVLAECFTDTFKDRRLECDGCRRG